MDKTLILNSIKEHLNLRFDKDFANFLGIKTTTLAMWYKRNTYDVELLFNKCEFLNPEWLLTGQGSMLKSELKKEDKPSTEGNNTVELDQLRKENAMQAKIIAGLEFQVATLEQRLAQDKSVTRGVLVPAMAEPAPQLKEKTS